MVGSSFFTSFIFSSGFGLPQPQPLVASSSFASEVASSPLQPQPHGFWHPQLLHALVAFSSSFASVTSVDFLQPQHEEHLLHEEHELHGLHGLLQEQQEERTSLVSSSSLALTSSPLQPQPHGFWHPQLLQALVASSSSFASVTSVDFLQPQHEEHVLHEEHELHGLHGLLQEQQEERTSLVSSSSLALTSSPLQPQPHGFWHPQLLQALVASSSSFASVTSTDFLPQLLQQPHGLLQELVQLEQHAFLVTSGAHLSVSGLRQQFPHELEQQLFGLLHGLHELEQQLLPRK